MPTYTLRRIVILLLSLLAFLPLRAQLNISAPNSTGDALESLFGAGVTVSNLSLNCDTTLALGVFDDGLGSLGLDNGLVLSTGSVFELDTANTVFNASTSLNFPGDPDLSLISGQNTFDACVIEFDIQAVCDTIQINYVFGSEEYPQFVNLFNDAFAFLIDGAGYNGLTNIALVPGTTTPVSINTINFSANSTYYVDNVGGTEIKLDGYTTPLTAYALVIPDSTYRVKLAIADALDPFFDSGIFLQREGICANTGTMILSGLGNNGQYSPTITLDEGDSTMLEFHRAIAPTAPTTYHFTVGGTATNGVDYALLADSVILPAGQTRTRLPIQLLADCETEGTETLVISYSDASLDCGGGAYTTSFELQITDGIVPGVTPVMPILNDTLVLCAGDTLSLGGIGDTSTTYQWTPALGLSNPLSANPDLSLTQDTAAIVSSFYVLTGSTPGCSTSDSVLVQVRAQPAITSVIIPAELCTGEAAQFEVQASFAEEYAWDFGNGQGSTHATDNYTYLTDSTFTVEVSASNGNCVSTFTQILTVSPLPALQIVNGNDMLCLGDTLLLTADANHTDTWVWYLGNGDSLLTSTPSLAYTYNQAGSYPLGLSLLNPVCTSQLAVIDTISVLAYPTLEEVSLDVDTLCAGEGVEITAIATDANTYTWAFGEGSTGSGNPVTHTYADSGVYQLTLTMGNASCEADFELELSVEACKLTHLSEGEASLKIYPNPSSEMLQVEWSGNGNAQLTLFSLSGQRLETQTFTGNTTLNVSELPTGWYMLEVRTSQQRSTQKLRVVH